MRQQGGGGPIKPKKKQFKDEDDGMSSELQKLLARRNKIIEEVCIKSFKKDLIFLAKVSYLPV